MPRTKKQPAEPRPKKAFAHARVGGKGGRYYIDPQGRAYYRVTSLLSALNKPALPAWAAREVATYAVENWRQIAGLRNKEPQDAIDFLKGVPWRMSRRRADHGTAVHRAIENYVLDKPQEEPEGEVADVLEGFIHFLEDWSPVFEASEMIVYNQREVYAGTLDAVVRIGSSSFILDVKTGSNVYPDASLQLAAYRHASHFETADGLLEPMPETTGAVVLHLQPHTYELIPVRADEVVLDVFRFARELYRWQNETSTDVIAQPAAPDGSLIWAPRANGGGPPLAT